MHPQLKECVESAEKHLRESCGFNFKSYIEAQLAYFFSSYRMSFDMDNWKWFLHVCNQSDISKHNIMYSHNILLLYLSRVLLLGDEMDEALGIFNPMVCSHCSSIQYITDCSRCNNNV